MRVAIKKRIGCAKGFTIVEVLLAMVIGLIIIGAVFMATTEGHKASTGIEQKISVGQDVRAALDIMGMEIAMASYNPLGATNVWINPNGCGAGGVVSAYRGIQTATATQLSVEMDTNENGIIGDANEIITYTYYPANSQISKNVNCVGDKAFLGDVTAPSATARNVLVVNQQVGINMFRYFDGNNNEFNPMTPANIPNIRKIRITIAVQAAAPDIQGQLRSMVYSTDVIPRNHVIATVLP